MRFILSTCRSDSVFKMHYPVAVLQKAYQDVSYTASSVKTIRGKARKHSRLGLRPPNKDDLHN